jgi:hypothetical protein
MTSSAEPIHGDTNVFNVLDRIGTAIELYRDGHTWEEVAQVCGYASRGSAHSAVTAHLRRNVDQNVTDMRAIEGRRFDADELRLRQIIATSTDEKMVIRAIEARTRLSARRARLFGLDAPLNVSLDLTAAQAFLVDRVQGILARRQAETGGQPPELVQGSVEERTDG